MFSKPSTVLYITSQGIQVTGKEVSFLMTFPMEVYDHQDVLDESKFEQIVSDALTQNKLEPGEGVILLGEELLYQKEISTKDPEEAQQELDRFINKLPFDNNNIEKIRFYNQDLLHVIAANGHLFHTIKSVLVKNGWKINFILPAPAAKISGVKELAPEQVPELLSEVDSLKKFNFLTQPVDVSTPKDGEKEAGSGSYTKWIVMTLVGVAIFAILGGGYWYRQKMMIPPKAVTKVDTVSVIPSATPVASPSAAPLSKADVLVQVLNGSGISGQAGKVKNLLTKAGFENVEVGNYPGANRKGTLVNYKSSVPESLRQELITELSESVASVSAEATASGDFDMVVVTGR